jgi:hypothetical protein
MHSHQRTGGAWQTVASSLVLLALAGCGGSQENQRQPNPQAQPSSDTAPPADAAAKRRRLVSCGNHADARVPRPEKRLFAPNSVWNQPLPETTRTDKALAEQLQTEAAKEIRNGTGPYIQTWNFSTPLYTVGPTQRCVRVKLDVTARYGRTLKRAFVRVPLPAGAKPAAGTDHHLTLWQPSTDSLWEFWKLQRRADGWHAAWGGAMRQVSRSPGFFSSKSWPGAASYWGATATSLPAIAGTMTAQELERGRIDHALAISIPNARAKVFALPAQRTDGTLTDPAAIPEGARFRLDPQLDLDRLDLPPVVRTMAIAAQRYGLIVRDKTLANIGFFAEDPVGLGRNPYRKLFEGKYPSVLLAKFPWSHLQAVKPRLRQRSGP